MFTRVPTRDRTILVKVGIRHHKNATPWQDYSRYVAGQAGSDEGETDTADEEE